MSSKTKARAWITGDGYLGVTGADSLDEMASVIAAHPEVCDELEAASVSVIREFLDTVTVRPVIVPVAVYRQERWDGSHMYSTKVDAKPGRGRVKVLGVHL